MKIRQLLERDTSVPSTAEYEYQFQLPNGEWSTEMIEISGYVHTEHDPYNTGDSPTQTTFEPVEATVKSTGKPFDMNLIKDHKVWDQISHEAAERAGY